MQKANDKPVKISEKRSRHTFRINDYPSDVDTMQARLYGFIREVLDQPALLHAGPTYARKIAIYHDGERWVLAGEAEADEV